MNESELVEGAEYEGFGSASGKLRCGRFSRAASEDKDKAFGAGHVALLGVIDEYISPRDPCWVRLDTIRRIDVEIAEKDRLFEGEVCCLCGSPGWSAGEKFENDGQGRLAEGRANRGLRICSSCCRKLGWDGCDAEITRRRALAAIAALMKTADACRMRGRARETEPFKKPVEHPVCWPEDSEYAEQV